MTRNVDDERIKIMGTKKGTTTITLKYKYYVAPQSGVGLLPIRVEKSKTYNIEIVDLVNETEEVIEDSLRDTWGLTGYHEVYLRKYNANEIVDMIVEKRYTSYTNSDNPERELTLTDKQFDYDGNVNWEEDESKKFKKCKIENLELKCIKETTSSLWHEGEVWKFNYEFYYMPESKKICFQYSSEIVKDANGEEVNDSSTNSDRFENNTETAEEAINKILAVMKYLEGESRPSDFTFKDVLEEEYKVTVTDTPTEFGSAANKIFTVILNIAKVISILMLAILGVKYMLGSVEDKSEYKKDLVPYIIGAFLVFSITTIVSFLQQIGESINK